jgi:hypothetical protein
MLSRKKKGLYHSNVIQVSFEFRRAIKPSRLDRRLGLIAKVERLGF